MSLSPFALAGRHAPAFRRLVPAAQRTRVTAAIYPRLPASARAAAYVRQLRRAAASCAAHGSPLNARLLTLAADDVDARGVCWTALDAVARERGGPRAGSAGSLMAAIHRVVLETPGTALEPHFPSTGGRPGPGLDEAFARVVGEHRTRIAELTHRPVQTNEVARCRALIGGFLLAGAETGLPLRILEMGASAGLNLRWDHYRYEDGATAWGDPASPVILAGDTGAPPPLHLDAEVAERAGCDLRPIDPRTEEGRLSLLAHVWPDQVERTDRLRAAFEVAARVDAPVVRADAASWIAEVLREPAHGRTTVVFDTAVMEYLDLAGRRQVRATIEAAGARADATAPLAWLHPVPHPGGGHGVLELVMWPGGERRQLARLDPHARTVRWTGPGAERLGELERLDERRAQRPGVGDPAADDAPDADLGHAIA